MQDISSPQEGIQLTRPPAIDNGGDALQFCVHGLKSVLQGTPYGG